MKKYLKLHYLALGLLLSLLVLGGRAWATPFYVVFNDGDGDGNATFNIVLTNNSATNTFWVGLAPTDHSVIPPGIQIDPQTSQYGPESIYAGIYDVFVYDGTTYYWTSENKATYLLSYDNSTLTITWNPPVPVSSFAFTFTGDTFGVQVVPLPGALLLLGSGVAGLALVGRKKVFRK